MSVKRQCDDALETKSIVTETVQGSPHALTGRRGAEEETCLFKKERKKSSSDGGNPKGVRNKPGVMSRRRRGEGVSLWGQRGLIC